MPVQKGKVGGLLAKYGAKLDRAVQAHATDETTYGMMRVPPGITNGIAKLVDAKFDVYKTGRNEGEYYFRAAGVIVEPASVVVNGVEVPCAGLQTSIMEAVCDTTKQDGTVITQEEHVENILNEMRKLAGPEFTEGATGADLETLAEQLKEAGPYFRFSTSRRAPRPGTQDTEGVWENWYGCKGLEDYVPPEGGTDAVEDNTPPARPAPKTNGVAAKPPAKSPAGGKVATKAKQPKPEPEPEFNEEQDLASLAEAADGGDEAATDRLTELALAAGAEQDAIDAAASWGEVVEMIEQGGAGAAGEDEGGAADTGEEGEEGADWEPQPEEVYLYTPLDPKTKKPAKKPVEVEVESVNKKKRTVNLKNIANPKLKYPGVAWDNLESAD